MNINIKTKTWEDMRSSARRIFPVVGAVVAGALSLTQIQASVHAEEATWGPTRPTYTWKNPADHVTFNSMTDNPEIGNESNFVRVRKAGTHDPFVDNVTVEAGAEYEVSVYYHNNASAKLNEGDRRGIAENVRLYMNKITDRLNPGEAALIKGTITSSNATPKAVWDTAYLNSKETVSLRYVPNSAKLTNSGSLNGTILNDDALFGKDGGTFLGYSKGYWGMIPGCNEFAGHVNFRIKVDKAGFTGEKMASKENMNDYRTEITVAPGETIDFKLRYKNTGTTIQRGVSAYDLLGTGMTAIPGTTFLKTPRSAGFEKENLFKNGFNIGDYNASEEAFITYKVKFSEDEKIFPCGDTVTYNNSAIAVLDTTIHSKVKVTVHRDCADKPKTPNTPKELPHTGASETVLAVVVTAMIGIGTAYYIASTKQLKALEKQHEDKE